MQRKQRQNDELRNTVNFAKPAILKKIFNIYATSFYGSGTWDIFSSECEKLYKSWNVTIRIFNLDRCTHRYLIESISQCLHPKIMIASRYVSFYRSLVNSKKFCVRFLARLSEMDQRTVLGRTLGSLLSQCDLPQSRLAELTASLVKKKCSYMAVPEAESWRIPLLIELLKVRDGQLHLENLDYTENKNIIDHLCVSY